MTVKDGKVVESKQLDKGYGYAPPLSQVPTIEELVETARRAEDGADSAEMVYSGGKSYPDKIDIDWLADAIDDEECYVIDDVSPR